MSILNILFGERRPKPNYSNRDEYGRPRLPDGAKPRTMDEYLAYLGNAPLDPEWQAIADIEKASKGGGRTDETQLFRRGTPPPEAYQAGPREIGVPYSAEHAELKNTAAKARAKIAQRELEEDTEVDGVEVSPLPPPPPPPPPPVRNPYTDDYLIAAQAAADSQAQLPRISGGTDAGLFGFLPKSVQQGRFRDIIGAIGDGILLDSGHNPIYAPRKEARLQGQALLGYQSDPQSALERLAQTGTPDSLDLMKGLQTEYQRSEDRAAQREMTQEYRNEVNRLKKEKVLQDLSKVVPGVLARATTPELYTSAWERLDQMARRIDDKLDATTAFGIPYPEDWTPEMTAWYGVTGNQMITSDVQREAEQGRNSRLNVMEGGRNYRANLAEDGRNYRANLAEDGRNNRAKPKPKPKPQTTTTTTTTTTTKPQAGRVPPPVPGYPQARNMDVDWLKKNDTPQNRKIFERQFGPGTAKLFLGK